MATSFCDPEKIGSISPICCFARKIETAEKHQVKEALLLCAKQLAETRNGVDNNTVGLKERIEKKTYQFPYFFCLY